MKKVYEKERFMDLKDLKKTYEKMERKGLRKVLQIYENREWLSICHDLRYKP